MEDTLHDEAWKDSFDKLLDPRPQLRILNIIKTNVRASFNLDSSVENSNHSILEINEPGRPKQQILDICDDLNEVGKRSISTPFGKRLGADLFHCGISPITGMKLDGFGGNTEKQQDRVQAELHIKKRVCFEIESKNTIGNLNELNSKFKNRHSKKKSDERGLGIRSSLVLQPGKWRKSLSSWRRTQVVETTLNISANSPLLTARASTHVRTSSSVSQGRKSIFLNDCNNIIIDYESQVLKHCDQRKPLRFDVVYAQSKMLNAKKIGEGAYGEVFRYTMKRKKGDTHNSDVVLKVIPIEGSTEVNGELQKTFAQILPEIIISKKMCSLRLGKNNTTDGYANIYKVSLVRDDQLFIVLELKFSGEDMSNFKFVNAEQSYYALQQIILALAVGEEECQFEHRDLHWGNILIEPATVKEISYKFHTKDLTVFSKGVKITIIDYTLSRITIDEFCNFNDLSSDEELFAASGDYQYDIYRLMRDELKNNWASFAPKTNVLWLSYVTAKLINGIFYKSANTKIHRLYIEKLKKFQSTILSFESATHCVKHVFDLN
ncbi:serine/threonine-protein kinase haspin homolog isoform X2 [Drosophila obscura]|uniref:serine/threonine-protein kinase haspin homolog isoform X2 n=1 Tax=Drosophila obscura TaxID=7282 RepID=UPI001BB17711|nr:serine/threonine-protein kinase haspin homolog isoform X2 [Drosophila obscura]